MTTAARYRPSPKTLWLARLLSRFFAGAGVRDDAMPAPMAGCMTSQGAATVAMPMHSAGSSVGLCTQSLPAMPARKPAKLMPVA